MIVTKIPIALDLLFAYSRISVKGSDYSLDVNKIPHPPKHGCLRNQIYRERFGTCSCDAHCSWDLCRSSIPPSECLIGTNITWNLDNVKNAWVAQLLEGNNVNLYFRKKIRFHEITYDHMNMT